VTFASWKKSLNVDAAKLRTIRRIIHWELAAVVVILLCAALMARGIGFVG
jgi:putative membrane protein